MLRNSLNGDRRNGVVTEHRRDIRPTGENALKTTPTSFQALASSFAYVSRLVRAWLMFASRLVRVSNLISRTWTIRR